MILEGKYWFSIFLLGALFISGCSIAAPEIQSLTPTVEVQPIPTNTLEIIQEEPTPGPAITPATPTVEIDADPTEIPGENTVTPTSLAEVVSVSINGEPGNYMFSVMVSSPDEGCSQYADWWEVISPEGELIYRRVLLHSHVGEQPFTRSGGPVPIETDTVVLVRAHMNTSGYGDLAMKGSPEQGFEPIQLSPDFAANLSEMAPLPGDCGF